MKRFIITTLIVALAALLLVAVVKIVDALDPAADLGYTVTSPTGWSQVLFENEGHDDFAWLDNLALRESERGDISKGARVWISTYEYPSGLKLDEFVSNWATEGLLKIASLHHIDISGIDSISLDYEFENIKGSVVFTYYSGKLYQIGLAIHDFGSFPSEAITDYLNTFGGLVSSFDIKK